jgi:predicted transcriptional regulator
MTGEEFRALRREAGVSQGAVAERANVDVSLLSRYESGQRPMPPQRVGELVTIVGEIVHDRQVAAARRAVHGATVSLQAALQALDRVGGNAA